MKAKGSGFNSGKVGNANGAKGNGGAAGSGRAPGSPKKFIVPGKKAKPSVRKFLG